MLYAKEKAMPTRKKPGFSVTKAVKSNARDQIGSPPPGRVLPDEKAKAERRGVKHKTTLAKVLQSAVLDQDAANKG